MNGFWWGQGAKSSGIRWMTWDKLCVSKYGGGLGVRSLRCFNTAMLAKQGWRILTKANSLVFNLLKAQYFPRTDFLNAELGANPSYLWRSILSAQDAIKAGCRKKIGDGARTKVCKVPWLPCKENGYVSTTLIPELHNINVQSLIDIYTNTWDSDLLDELFNDRDRQLIRRVPIPLQPKCDSWFWLLNPKGQFIVKSMYQQLQGPYDMSFRQ
ncbi:hypothetical protein AgCh_019707 [Apium graveolens]